MTEVWKPVIGYEGLYEVSSLGRVKSLARTVHRSNGIPQRIPEKYLRLTVPPIGHVVVSLYKLGGGLKGSRKHQVHRLVLESFVGPCPEGMQALHWNDTYGDNRLENLRWGTSTENSEDLVRNGKHGMKSKIRCKRGHLLQMPNLKAKIFEDKGWRACKVCHREKDIARFRGEEFNEERAWDLYREIMGELINE